MGVARSLVPIAQVKTLQHERITWGR